MGQAAAARARAVKSRSFPRLRGKEQLFDDDRRFRNEQIVAG
jgi:hypothetical protein